MMPLGGQGESETGRLEAFSDGVLAVIITIMALELKAPVEGTFASLRERLPALLVYILSFTFIGIYWNNHHHLLRAARRVTAGVMWSNLQAIGRDVKGRASLAIYAAATALAFVSPWISYALFVAVSVMWFIPDRRLTDR